MDCTRLRSSSGHAWRLGLKAKIAVTAGEIMAVILRYGSLGLGSERMNMFVKTIY